MDFREERLGLSLLGEAGMGNALALEALLAQGASPLWKDASGRDALMMAVWGLSLDCVHQLLAAGANPKAQDQRGHTALMLSIMTDQPEVTTLLLPLSNAWACDREGKGALSMAVEGRQQHCLIALAQRLPSRSTQWEESGLEETFGSEQCQTPGSQASASSDPVSLSSGSNPMSTRPAWTTPAQVAKEMEERAAISEQGRRAFERALELRLWEGVDALSRQASEEMAQRALAAAHKEGGLLPQLQARMEREQLRVTLFEARSAVGEARSGSFSHEEACNHAPHRHAPCGGWALTDCSPAEASGLSVALQEGIRYSGEGSLEGRANEEGDKDGDGGESGAQSGAGGENQGQIRERSETVLARHSGARRL